MLVGVPKEFELAFAHLHDLSDRNAVPAHFGLVMIIDLKGVYVNSHIALLVP